jgi:hypothetical protein
MLPVTVRRRGLAAAVVLMRYSGSTPSPRPSGRPSSRRSVPRAPCQPGGVFRVGMPRSDLNVTAQGVAVRPGFALGSNSAKARYRS